MSHFSVAVFSKMPGYVEALLAPFEEQVDPDSPYAEFVENEECDLDKTVGAGGYWHNPNARWDWWEIGGRGDGARVADCDFSPDTSRVARLQREWEVLVEGAAQREGEDFISIWKPEYYLQRYGDKETYIRRETAFSTYAFVTADGAWHEQGRMGWFGFDDATNESMNQYEKEFQAYLQEARENGLAITIVDCHI